MVTYKDDLKIIARIQKDLKKNPDLVRDILIAADIIDEDNQLKAPYNGEHDWIDFNQTSRIPEELHTYREWNSKGYYVMKEQKGKVVEGEILFDKTQVQRKNTPSYKKSYAGPRFSKPLDVRESGVDDLGYHRFCESQFDGDRGGYYTETVRTHTGSSVTVDRYENGRSRVHWGGPCGYTDYNEFGEEC